MDLATLFGQSDQNHTTIKGSIRLPDTITLAIGIYQNMRVEYDPKAIYTWSNNVDEAYEFHFQLSESVMLEFYVTDAHRYRFYISPGSVNVINIDGERCTYEGQTAAENAILRQLDFHKAPLRRPGYTDMQDLTRCLMELDNVCDAMEREVDTTSCTDDFRQYIRCELIGYRYFWKSNLLYRYHTDTLGLDTLPSEMAEEVRSLYDIHLVDEVRSRYYLNAVSGYVGARLKSSLTPVQEANYGLFIMASFQSALDFFSSYPKLRNVFMASTVGTSVFRAKTKEELEIADYLFAYYPPRTFMQENAFAVIRAELDQKRARMGVNAIEDFVLQDIREASVALSAVLEEGVNIISLWASWCKPCIEKFPAMTSLAEKHGVNLIHVCIWSTRSAWSKVHTAAAISPEPHLFADKALSERIADQCSVTQFPMYVIVDKQLHVLAIQDSYSGLMEWLADN